MVHNFLGGGAVTLPILGRVTPSLISERGGESRFSAFNVLRLVLGVLLVAAAALKGHLLAVGADGVNEGWILFALMEFELFGGIWMLAGIAPVVTRWAAVALFTLLAGSAGYQGLIGVSRCDCLGVLSVHPWIMCSVDVGAALCLLTFAPHSKGAGWPRPLLAKSWGRLLMLVLALAGVVYGSTFVVFESPFSALAWLRGDPVTINPAVIDLGECDAGEERMCHFQLTNSSDHAVTVVGGTTTCSCLAATDLPLTIPPGESRSVRIVLRPSSGRAGEFNQTVTLYIDGASLRAVQGRISGRFARREGSSVSASEDTL